MAKDLVGNDLKVGDFITLSSIIRQLGNELAGKITYVSEGGIAPPNMPRNTVMAGTMRVLIEFSFPFDPTRPCNVIKIQVPETKPVN